ncbi:MAG: hypothetical protein EBR82_66265 [Caulobacteraceae bacterium]|nr:hypothetical protein [Caulobacteraceae bacterium]
MAAVVLAYEQAANYRQLNPDLTSVPSAISLDAAMTPTHYGLADSSHAYSHHGSSSTILGRIDRTGAIETLTVPASRRSTIDGNYLWSPSTDSGGTLYRVDLSTFSGYDTWSIDAGTDSSYSTITDGIAVDDNGDLWICTRQAAPSPVRPKLTKFDTSAETFGPSYTIVASVGITDLTVAISGTYAYLTQRDGNNDAFIYKVDLSDGSLSASLDSGLQNPADLIIIGTNGYLLGTDGSGVVKLVKFVLSTLTIDTTLTVAADGSYSRLTTDGTSIWTAGGNISADQVHKVNASTMTLDVSLTIGVSLTARLATYFDALTRGWVVGSVGW